MNLELTRIEPLRAANALALVYGLLACAFVLLVFIPFVLFAALVGPSSGPGLFETTTMGVILLFYPLLGLVSGWITGALTALIYNLVIRWTGGFLLRLEHAAGDAPLGAIAGDA